MADSFRWENYIHLVEFLGECLGDNTEIVLHDLTDSDRSVIAISNGHITDRTVNAPLTIFALNKLTEMQHSNQSSIVNYKGTSRKGTPLRSSSFIIRDTQNQPIGMLCINIDVSAYHQAEEVLRKLSYIPELKSNEKPLNELPENFHNSVSDMVADAFQEIFGQEFTPPPNRLTATERMKIVEQLSQKGLFLVKGAISEVATHLSTSEATIYRYINKINKAINKNVK